MNTLESQNLLHLVEFGYIPPDPTLDQQQRAWLFVVLEEKFRHPFGKAIITKYVKTKDTRLIWKEMLEYYDTSNAATIRCQKISTYITSTRITDWKGSISSFFIHMNEQFRQYDELSETPYTQDQKRQFVQTAIQGMPQLSVVYQQHQAAVRSTTGSKPNIHYDEIYETWIETASEIDAS